MTIEKLSHILNQKLIRLKDIPWITLKLSNGILFQGLKDLTLSSLLTIKDHCKLILTLIYRLIRWLTQWRKGKNL